MTKRYDLNIGPPAEKQAEIISYILEPEPTRVKQVNVMCGLAFAKTTLGIDLACRVLSMQGQRILFLEPDKNRMENVFLAEWIKIVPAELYTLNYGKRYIRWKPTGSILLYDHRDIRGNKALRERRFQGINLTGVISDEEAEGFLMSQYQFTFNRIRVKSPVRFWLSLTTPIAGEYSRIVKHPLIKQFRGTSWDNPYLEEGYIEGMIANMNRDQVRREIYGELIALEGRVFREAKIDAADAAADKENRWPHGNVHWEFSNFRPEQPWWLFADLGSATGANVVVQNTGTEGRFRGPVWVAIADLCSDSDASASRAFQQLKDEFGTPAGVVAGADAFSRDKVDGTTVAYFAQSIWGPVPIYPADESRGGKLRGMDRMNYLLNSTQDHRRFCVAKNFKSLDPDSRRGVREVLLEFVHVPLEERQEDYIYPKGHDQPLCHIADALMMGASQIMAPPSFFQQGELAK